MDEPTDPFMRGHSVLDRRADGEVLLDQLAAMDVRQSSYAILGTLTRTDLENIALATLLDRLLAQRPQEEVRG